MDEKKVLLDVKDLEVRYYTDGATVCAVNGISFDLDHSQTLAMVGETGAGKTTTALSILGLVPDPPGKVTSGTITFDGECLTGCTEKQLQKIRGNTVTMIFQDPMTSLNPVMTIGNQIAEVVKLHNKDVSAADASKKAVDMLEMVGISEDRYNEYPHQFSGGMRQRVMIAMALACNPKMLIADEPTTALDVTIQAQVLELMNELKSRLGTSVILITHDLGVVAEVADKVAIMYAGEIVEYGMLRDIYKNTKHPYTKGLFASIPKLEGDEDRLKTIPGMMPDPSDLPEGCKFHPRCSQCMEKCKTEKPQNTEITPGHFVRCHLYSKMEG